MMEDQELYSAEHFDLESWKRILKIIVKDKKSLVLMLLAVIVMTCIDIGYPLLNKYALETFFSETPNFDSVPFFIILYSLIALSMGVSVWAFIRAAAKVEERTTFEIRMQAFKICNSYRSPISTTPRPVGYGAHDFGCPKTCQYYFWGLVDFVGIPFDDWHFDYQFLYQLAPGFDYDGAPADLYRHCDSLSQENP